MANHRMISTRVANSATFLQMPAESQLLFFHMLLRADDDGVVEAYPILRLLGVAPDVFRILEARGFIKQLNADQVVVISDWVEHNTIRPDRKVNSMYFPLLMEKFPTTQVVIPRPRSDVLDNSKRVDGPRPAEVKLSQGNKKELSKNESSLLREVHEREDGSERHPRVIRAPKDRTAWKLMHVFGDKCHKTLGTRPVLGVKECAIVSRALKHITESQMLDLFDEWFEFGHSDDETISIGKALSNRQIEQYKLRNEIV